MALRKELLDAARAHLESGQEIYVCHALAAACIDLLSVVQHEEYLSVIQEHTDLIAEVRDWVVYSNKGRLFEVTYMANAAHGHGSRFTVRLDLLDKLYRCEQPPDFTVQQEGVINICWRTEDVQYQVPRLTDAQALEVLHAAENQHDCNYGICWDTLTVIADLLYPESGD